MSIMTNYEKIKQKTPKEFADFMDTLNGSGNAPYCKFCAFNKRGWCDYHCIEGYQRWLESEVDEQ